MKKEKIMQVEATIFATKQNVHKTRVEVENIEIGAARYLGGTTSIYGEINLGTEKCLAMFSVNGNTFNLPLGGEIELCGYQFSDVL